MMKKSKSKTGCKYNRVIVAICGTVAPASVVVYLVMVMHTLFAFMQELHKANEHYENLETERTAYIIGKIHIEPQAPTVEVARTVIREVEVIRKAEQSTAIYDVIKLTAQSENFDPNIVLAVAIHESGLDPDATNLNSNGTSDYGLYQFNDITLENYGLDIATAKDPVKSTIWFCYLMSQNMSEYGLYDGLRAYAAGRTGMKNGKGYAFADDIMQMLGEKYER